MDIERYRTFVVAAECTSFAKAADRLFLSAPTVTKHISALEHEMGIKLFERTNQGIHLSAEGKKRLPLARQLVYCYDGLNMMNQDQNLEIYSVPCIEKIGLPEFLSGFLLKRSEFSVSINECHSTEIIDALLAGRCELAFMGSSCADRNDLDCMEIFHERVCVAVSENHPFAYRKSVSLLELAEEPFIMLTQESGLPGYYEKCCRKYGFKPKVKIVCSREESQLGYVAKDMGIAFFTFGRKHDWKKEGLRFIPIEEELYSGCILAKLKGSSLSAPASAFWKYMSICL